MVRVPDGACATAGERKKNMKVTVCQFHDDPKAFEIDWQMLVAHVRIERSDFVLLPEMPF